MDIGVLGPKLYHNLGGVCLLLGEYPEAREWWNRALSWHRLPADESHGHPAHAPGGFVPSGVELFKAAMANDDFRTAAETVQAVYRIEGPSETWADLEVTLRHSRGESPIDFLRYATAQYPYSTGPRLLLMRRLLATGAEEETVEHMRLLDALDSAEAAFNLGVYHSRRGHFRTALAYMERSYERNPASVEAAKQIESLKALLASG